MSSEAGYELKEFSYTNKMRVPRIEKIVVNVGVGESGDRLIKAEKVLGSVTGKKPVRTLSKKNVRDWNLRPGQPIGCKVTIRGTEASEWLKKALTVRQNKIYSWNVDDHGNLNFGVTDHTDIPGQKYDPEIGIFGMNVTAVITRPGARIRSRRLLRTPIHARSRVTREESISWLVKNFNVEVLE